MRYQVIISPYVKDLGKVIDNAEDEILCNAEIKTAIRIAACLETCDRYVEAHTHAEEFAKSTDIIKPHP